MKTNAAGQRPRVRVPTIIEGESRTHQEFAKECDINQIMKKWEKTGVIDHRNTYQGTYGDFTNVPSDYHEAQNQVLEANEMFSSLPSKIRKKFQNDPGQFLEFVADPNNSDEMIALGLATPRQMASDVLDDTTPEAPSKPSKTPPTEPPKQSKD